MIETSLTDFFSRKEIRILQSLVLLIVAKQVVTLSIHIYVSFYVRQQEQ